MAYRNLKRFRMNGPTFRAPRAYSRGRTDGASSSSSGGSSGSSMTFTFVQGTIGEDENLLSVSNILAPSFGTIPPSNPPTDTNNNDLLVSTILSSSFSDTTLNMTPGPDEDNLLIVSSIINF